MRRELADNFFEPIEATIINPIVDSSWDEEVSSHPHATVFHTSAWARVLIDTYGHQPCYLRLTGRSELRALVPMMEVRSLLTPRRGICLPFSDRCAPLLCRDAEADAISAKLRQVGRERSWNYFELKDGLAIPEGAPASESYWSHTLDLAKNTVELSANFSSSTRRALRKAERSDLAVTVNTTAEAMNQFYSLHVKTRRKHGVPPQPRSFFTNIQKHIIEKGLGFIVLAKKAECPAAAGVFFKLGRHALYKFGASDKKWQEFRPSNLVMAEAIKFLHASSVATLDFGRTDKTNEGLRRFKLSWGAEEGEISYGKFSILADNWVQARSHQSSLPNRIFRALPAPMNRLAGLLLYPHLD